MNQKLEYGYFGMLFLILSILSTPVYTYEIPVIDSTMTFDLSDNQGLRSNNFLQAQTFKADMPFTAIGIHWTGEQLVGSYNFIELSTSKDGNSWTDWMTVEVDEYSEENPKGEFFSSLITVGGKERTHEYVKFRVSLIANEQGEFPTLDTISFTFFDGGITPPKQLESIRRNNTLRRSGVSKPYVVSRRGWGADESIMKWSPEYSRVTHLIIHHTAGNNSAPNGDWASVVRTIYKYHAKTKGWGDIGYHYLVDPNGTIYEGRSGGDDVVGGHVPGYNNGTMAISFIGNFNTKQPSSAALRSAEKLLAWKSFQRGINPLQSGKHYTGKTVAYISGHRDWTSTACPGGFLYEKLPTIRQNTMALLGGYVSLSQGVNITPSRVVLGKNFTVNFTLKETSGVSKSFERIAVAILRENNSHLFDFKEYYNITISANNTWSKSATGRIYSSNSPGTYKVAIRGRVQGGKWFNFSTTDSGINPISFSVSTDSNNASQYINKCIAKYSGYFGSKSGSSYSCYDHFICQNTTGGTLGDVTKIALLKDLSQHNFWYYWNGWGKLSLDNCK